MAEADARQAEATWIPGRSSVVNPAGADIRIDPVEMCPIVFGSHHWEIPSVPSYLVFNQNPPAHIFDDYMCTCRRCGWQENVRVRPGELPSAPRG